jgi:hypothetical protein
VMCVAAGTCPASGSRMSGRDDASTTSGRPMALRRPPHSVNSN